MSGNDNPTLEMSGLVKVTAAGVGTPVLGLVLVEREPERQRR